MNIFFSLSLFTLVGYRQRERWVEQKIIVAFFQDILCLFLYLYHYMCPSLSQVATTGAAGNRCMEGNR